jgi:hypothetical protein
MKRRILTIIFILLNILVISLFIIRYTNATYPIVGNDYKLFISRLIDSHLYYKVNGFGIEWYTPSFGGGLPAYPNPLQMQFSLPQLITWFFNPWVAVMASITIYLAIGFIVTFMFLRDVLEFKSFAAILGANFFIASGFFIERAIIGHVDKITFPLIVIPIFALLNRKLPAWLAGVLISITGAILINSGGVYIGVMCLFTALVTVPLIYFIKPLLLSWQKILPVLIWGTILTLLLCGSKLYAITTLMQNFPRQVYDHYFVSWYSSLTGLTFSLIGAMTSLPFLRLIGKSSMVFVVRLAKWTGSPYSFWEQDISISPVLSFLLVGGIWWILSHKPRLERTNLIKKIIAGACLLFFIVLVAQFSTARGILYELLKGLPIFNSLRTNTRFAASFILPLSILGAKVFDTWSKKKSNARALSAYALLNVISLVSLWSYYLLPMEVQGRDFEITVLLNTYTKIQAGNTFPVNKIIPKMNDYEVFQAQASNTVNHYDPIYGENSFLPLVHEGSVFDIENGYYNMTDPTGYVFPSENGSKLFSRIPVSDYNKLLDFINRRKVDWKLPLTQIILDWAAGITFLLEFLAVLVYRLRK